MRKKRPLKKTTKEDKKIDFIPNKNSSKFATARTTEQEKLRIFFDVFKKEN